MTPYKDFTARLNLLISKNPHLITTTLSNIFTMRLIGNKTHGDLAEIAIAEFINQFMYDYMKGFDGWFTENYGGDPNEGSSIGGDGLKKPWQKHNTRRLDAIRDEIDIMGLSEEEKSVLLTSLILALDATDSTLGHFASYLNDWSSRSYKPLRLKIPDVMPNQFRHTVHIGNIFEVLPSVSADVAYLDPPYGSNNEKMPPSRVRYSAYYHLWTTICLNDKPELFGKVRRRCDTSDTLAGSVFEEFRKDRDGRYIAVKAIHNLLQLVDAKHIVLSYSSGGRATANELNDCIADVGKMLEVIEIDHKKNVMAQMRWTRDWIKEAEEPNREYLFLIEKNKMPNDAPSHHALLPIS